MKQIRLERLEIQNFKGISRLCVDPRGGGMDIYGRNATGKSSVYDAFLWLLLGKDSSGRADFGIKPLDGAGKTRDTGAETVVEAALTVNGKPLTLRKAYRENWARKRGQATAEFTGNTTDCQIDGVPVAVSEYKEYISDLIPEDIFKAITNLRAFCAWPMKERRALLLKMTGDMNFADLRAREFPELHEAMSDRADDELLGVLQKKRQRLNTDIKELPIRVDEALRAVDESAEGGDLTQVIAGLSEQREQALASGQLADETLVIELKSEARALQSRLTALDSENDAYRRDMTRNIKRQADAAQEPLRARLRETMDARDAAERVLRDEREQAGHEENELAKLRAEWARLDEDEWTGNTTCPTCKQALPEGDIAAAMARFENAKREAMQSITERGKALKPIYEARVARLNKLESEHAAALNAVVVARAALEVGGQTQLAEAQVEDMRGYANRKREIATELAEVNERIRKMNEETDGARMARDTELARIDAALTEAYSVQAKRAANTAARERAAELRAEHLKKGEELERVEQLLIQAEQYLQRRMEMVDARVSGLFKVVRFKLFEQQLNGGVSDACVATVDGVEYGDLNNAMQVNVGLDIIGALSAHFGISAPIFVDNAESVCELMRPDGAQVIRLIVSANDATLRIEADADLTRIAG